MKYFKVCLVLFTSGLISFGIASQPNKQRQEVDFSRQPKYAITVRHFIGVEGEILTWRITKDSVKVAYNCDWEGCKDTIVYQSSLDGTISNVYLSAIRSTGLDTLNGSYENKSLREGLYVNFEAQNVFDKPVKFSLHGVKMKSMNAFYRITDSLILTKTRFKLGKYW